MKLKSLLFAEYRKFFLKTAIFAGEAADYEVPEVLLSYFVDKDEFRSFYNPEVRFKIVMSKKGEGKSALLRYQAHRLMQDNNDIVCYLMGEDIARGFDEHLTNREDPNMYINSWQLSICRQINCEIGSKIKIALKADDIDMVELSEITGRKQKNLVGTIAERIKTKHIDKIEKEISYDKVLLERYMSDKKTRIWLIVDDIDATFMNNDFQRLKLSTFFTTCAKLTASVNGLNVRTCVRSDVWPLIRPKDEALDKIEQFIVEIKWHENETRDMLAKRISSYLLRNDLIQKIDINRPYDYIDLVFANPYFWGKNDQTRPPHVVIHNLSLGRPRWAIQISRLAAEKAKKNKTKTIEQRFVEASLEEYGNKRLYDLEREHIHQCPQVKDIILSFAQGPKRYTTNDLLDMINNKILNHISNIEIDGKTEGWVPGIARFIYRIGLITARKEKDARHYEHIDFKDNPDAFLSKANLAADFIWEIHPCYRDALQLKSDRELGQKKKKHRY